MVCMACHEADGRGALARKTMKDAEQIPDLTDPKWQASRTDAELEHSILEGKGKIMLARKDMLALAHTDVKNMVVLMRSFRSGKQAVTATGTAQPLPGQPAEIAVSQGPAAPVLSTVAAPAAPLAQPASPAPAPGPPALTTQTTVALALAPRAPQPASTNPGQTAAGSGPSASAAMPPGVATPPTGPPQNLAGPGIALPEALPISTAMSLSALRSYGLHQSFTGPTASPVTDSMEPGTWSDPSCRPSPISQPENGKPVEATPSW